MVADTDVALAVAGIMKDMKKWRKEKPMPRLIIENVTLRRCPFCGSSRVHQEFFSELLMSTIECGECGALISFAGSEDPETTAEKWNRRDYDHFQNEDICEKPRI